MTKRKKTKAWNQDKRTEAAQVYVEHGSWAECHRATGIPLITLYSWRNKDWWLDTINTIQKDKQALLGAKIGHIIDKAVDVTADRLENGNYVFDQKTGKIVRVPVNMKDTLKATTELLARQDKMRLQDTQEATQEAKVDRLQKLADELARFAKAKDVTPNKQALKDENGSITDLQPFIAPDGVEVYTDIQQPTNASPSPVEQP